MYYTISVQGTIIKISLKHYRRARADSREDGISRQFELSRQSPRLGLSELCQCFEFLKQQPFFKIRRQTIRTRLLLYTPDPYNKPLLSK